MTPTMNDTFVDILSNGFIIILDVFFVNENKLFAIGITLGKTIPTEPIHIAQVPVIIVDAHNNVLPPMYPTDAPKIPIYITYRFCHFENDKNIIIFLFVVKK